MPHGCCVPTGGPADYYPLRDSPYGPTATVFQLLFLLWIEVCGCTGQERTVDGPVAQLEGGANACRRAQWKRSPLFESVVIVGLRRAVEDSP